MCFVVVATTENTTFYLTPESLASDIVHRAAHYRDGTDAALAALKASQDPAWGRIASLWRPAALTSAGLTIVE